jgi:hypothetical protein
MPRQPRLDAPGALHHIIAQGIDRKSIFRRDQDRENFVNRLAEVVRARKLFCQLTIGRMGYPGAEVARFLGVTTSSVNRLAVSEEVVGLKTYLKLF